MFVERKGVEYKNLKAKEEIASDRKHFWLSGMSCEVNLVVEGTKPGTLCVLLTIIMYGMFIILTKIL